MIRILFVDDDPEILAVGKRFLEIHPDFVVDTVESAQGALFLLKQNPYDAIISDYFMPDMDGVMFLKNVRSFTTYIPFIIFTGHGEEGVVIEALNNGADFYLKKSYDNRSQFFELAQIIRLSVSRVKSDELLNKSEEKFRTIADYSHEWMYWIGPQGTLEYVSPSCEPVTGFTQEEFYQDPDLINRIVYEEDIPLWLKHQETSPDESGSHSIDFRIVHKNGKMRWVGHVSQSIFDTNGNYAGRRVSNRDISSRKNTETLLLKERDNFLKIFRAAPVGLLLLNTDTEITQANKAISALVLRDPAEIIQKRGGGGLGCIHSLEDPRGCGYSSSCSDCPLRNGIETVIREGISIHGAVIPLTLIIDGNPRTRWLSINAEPVDVEGDDYVIVAIDDITEQRETEESLRESEMKFRALSDSTPAGILVYQDDMWTYANPASEQISGYSQEELFSMCFWDIVHPDYQGEMRVQGQARQQGDDVISPHVEIIIIRKSGEERWVDLVGSTIIIGQKKAGLITVIDITDRKVAENNLTRSEAKYRLIFENQIDLFFQTDIEGIIQILSPSCKKLTGWEVNELVGTSAHNLYPIPKDRETLIDRLLLSGTIYDYETRMMNKAGNQIPISINCHLIRDQNGSPVWIEGTIRDISERKRIEDALGKSEEHYRSLFDNMLEGFAYCQMMYDDHDIPVDWMFLNVNDSFERITGLSDIIGKPVTDVIPGVREQTPELFEIYNRVVISGIPETFEINFTPLHAWLKVSVYRPEEGHFAAVFENISGQKKAEANLKKIIDDHQTILENVPAMIWYKDTRNTFIKVNPAAAQVFGRPIQDIEGKTFFEIFPDKTDSYYADDLEIIKNSKAKIGVVEYLTTAQGKHIWVQTDKIPLYDDHEEVIGVLVVSTDITERKMAKDAISHANKKLNLLSNITRHDIANELQIMFGYLSLIKEIPLEPRLRGYIEKVDVSAHHIERQIAFTRDYQDIGVNSPIWQDIRLTIDRVVRSFDFSSIHLHLDITGLMIYADPLLEKVFHNLVDNSMRYGEKITEIRFSGHEGPDGYVIICADDGIGIPNQYKSGIFKREYYKHTGFGLNLSREILEITGITMCETGQEGEGAQFEIWVPKGGYKFMETLN